MKAQGANIISAGTQVVAGVEIRGPNRALVHPRGAVGIITRTPAGAAALREGQVPVRVEVYRDRLPAQ